jgi:photosystem II stability/assembly factor-like uncharacterized protein
MSTPPISPVQNDAVFALVASGESLYAARASGLYRSGDGGVTWEDALVSLERRERFAVTAAAASGRTVIAGATGAILHSRDDGASWQIAALPTPAPAVTALAVSPNFGEDGLIAAGTAEDGIFVSTDRGENWIPWNFGLIDLHVNALAISANYAHDHTIFAGTESGVFRSLNGGRAWREVPFPTEFAPVLSLGITVNGRLFAGSENHGAFASDDSGVNWRQIEPFADGAVNTIHIRDSRVWLLFDEALAVSDDGGDTWTNDLRPLPPGKGAMALLPFPSSGAALVGFADGDLLQLQRIMP